ncbi:hypothetical protein CLOP_g16346 [Closterium sp. NIES-67]|nr:hypothetical protein CLOP_g16346 [Closterium sp. NIES-67]
MAEIANDRLRRIEEAAAAAKAGADPLKGMVAVAAQRLQDYFDKTRLVGGAGGLGQEGMGLKVEVEESGEEEGAGETTWQRWERVFADVEEREAMLTTLQFQLDDLVGDEDFTAAAKLQAAIRALEEQDAMAAVFRELKEAVAEERYSDAKHLRDDAGAGLVGWWAGLDESGSADPFGRLIHVTQQHGKLLAKSYTAKQLSVAGQGVPIFEVYAARHATNAKRFDQQVRAALHLCRVPAPRDSQRAGQGCFHCSHEHWLWKLCPKQQQHCRKQPQQQCHRVWPISFVPSNPSPAPSSVQRVQDAISFSWGKKSPADDGQAGNAASSRQQQERESGSAPTHPSPVSLCCLLPSFLLLPASSLPPGADDSLSRVLDFFKERLPDVKLRVFPVVSPADVAAPDGSGGPGTADIPRIVEDVVKRIARDRESAAAAAAGEAASAAGEAASAAGEAASAAGEAASAAGEADKGGKSGSSASDDERGSERTEQGDATDDESDRIYPSNGDTSESGGRESSVEGPRSSIAGESDAEAAGAGEAAQPPAQPERDDADDQRSVTRSRGGGRDDQRSASQLSKRDLRRLREFRERHGMSDEGTMSGSSTPSARDSGSDSDGNSSSSSSRGGGSEEIPSGLGREGGDEEGVEDADGRQGIAVRVVVGGVFPGDGAGESVTRVPARIEWRGRDAFLFTVEDSEGEGSEAGGGAGGAAPDSRTSQSTSTSSSSSSASQSAAVAAAVSGKLASAATRAAANLMPEDVAKQLWGVDRFSGPEVFKDKDVAQLIRTAVQHVQRRRYTLPRTTAFTRINVADANTDPFAGLYVGAYGPYTSEAIQVRRRFGTWEEPEEETEAWEADSSTTSGRSAESADPTKSITSAASDEGTEWGRILRSKGLVRGVGEGAKDGEGAGRTRRQGGRSLVPPFEYVEGVKLTGDFNVPAGKVSFRAKTGRHCQMPYRGVYPDELGVVARYPGQGQLAEPGFKNPRWVDGELLVFDGKGSRHTNGAELGFVFSLPERHFLILFNRLKLQA